MFLFHILIQCICLLAKYQSIHFILKTPHPPYYKFKILSQRSVAFTFYTEVFITNKLK